MKEKSIINQIKTLLGLQVKLEQMTLENGTVIEADSFEAGQAVFIVTEDGQVALPVGDYTLPDGKMLVVTEEGMIGEIKEAEMPEAEVEVEVEAAEVEVAPDVIAEEVVIAIEDVQNEVVAQVASIIDAATPSEVTTEDSAMIAEDVIAEIISVIESNVPAEMMAKLKANLSAKKKSRIKKSEMASMPAAKPIKPNPEKEVKKELKFYQIKATTSEQRILAKISQIKK